MSEIEKLRAANREIARALAVQQTLLRTLGVLSLMKISSSAENVRVHADLWHELIDDDRTSSVTPEPLKEEEREFARQYVDALAAIAAARKALGQ